MKNYLFPFLTSVILVLSGILNAQGNQEENKNNLFVIDDQTTISFLIPEDRYLYSKSVNENTNLLDLNNINFLKYRDDFDFESYQFYIKRHFRHYRRNLILLFRRTTIRCLSLYTLVRITREIM